MTAKFAVWAWRQGAEHPTEFTVANLTEAEKEIVTLGNVAWAEVFFKTNVVAVFRIHANGVRGF